MSPPGAVEVFAADNEAGGRNLVLVNGSTTRTAPVTVVFAGLAPGTARTFLTDPARPYAAPPVTTSRYSASVRVTLPPMSVATVVLAPRSS